MVLVYVAITILVWGLFALQRGLWQDDTALLAEAQRRLLQGRSLFDPVVSPTRRLFLFLYGLALATPTPLQVLQLLYGATWLGQGLLAFVIAGRLVPERPLTAYLAGALTLSATSDFLTNSPVALVYALSATEFLAALACALVAIERGARGSLGFALASAACLAASLWSTDAPLPGGALSPLLLFAAAGFRVTWGLTTLLGLWAAVLLPYLWVLAGFLGDARGYAHVAILPTSFAERAVETKRLFLLNFEPWRWPTRRPGGMDATALHALAPPTIAAASLAGVCVFLYGAFSTERRAAADPAPWSLSDSWRTIVCLAAALLSNAAYSFIHLSSLNYRTHIMARLWSSLALAMILGWLWGRRRSRLLALLLACAFVGLGVWGGLERQDFFLSAWRAHQSELESIVGAAPSFQAGTSVILRVPPSDRYLATQAEYLARSWFVLLYPGHGIARNVILWAPKRDAVCTVESDGWHCSRDGEGSCVGAGQCLPRIVPYGSTVVMAYDLESGRYRLVDPLPPELGGGRDFVDSAYAPTKRIVGGPMSDRQRAMLLLR